MVRLRVLAVSLALVALAACGGDDPFTADMKTICNAGQDPSLPPDMRRLAGLKEIGDKLKTPEAARLMSAYMQAHPSEREQILRPALDKAKLRRCRFLEE